MDNYGKFCSAKSLINSIKFAADEFLPQLSIINYSLLIVNTGGFTVALRQIRIDPDDILLKKSKPVLEYDEKMRALVEDMLETMYHSEGVGLAAVQVGILRRILVIDVSDEGDTPIVLINPEVLHSEGTQQEQEACLSVPGLVGLVERPKTTLVKGLNRYGDEYELHADGFLAVALHHELDHLDGILYTEKAIELYEETEEHKKKRKARKKKRRK
jgi:peptide deformylase